MYCNKCGQYLPDGQRFCSNCGADVSLGHQAYEVAQDTFRSAENELHSAVADFRGDPNPNPDFTGRLQTDRSLAMYIILSIVTCGIYSYYFVYKMAKDVNVACEGDGESTGGLAQFVLLSMVTCGIYAWIWYYKLGNRLAANAPRYGMSFQENGTTVLMWLIFGSMLCGIGPYIAMNILIKNTNKICLAYNRVNGL